LSYLSFTVSSRPPRSTPFPYTTLFRSVEALLGVGHARGQLAAEREPPPPRAAADGHRHGRLGPLRQREQPPGAVLEAGQQLRREDRKSTRLNSSHVKISYAVFCLKKKR